MKKIKISFLSVLFICLTFINCNSKQKSISSFQKDELTAKADIFISDWHKAASEADYENYFGKMDSLSIFIGTDYNENWKKSDFEEFSKPYFDRGKAWSFSAINRNIYMNDTGEFIWFDELLQTWMGICRGSGVIYSKDGKLTLNHYVLSVTVPNDKVNAFLDLKPQELDSSFVQSLSTRIPSIEK